MEKNIEEFYSFISSQSKQCSDNFVIDPELYDKLNVKRGLRDKNGNGVLAGLTSISSVESFKIETALLMLKGTALRKPLTFFCSESFRIRKSLRTSAEYSVI